VPRLLRTRPDCISVILPVFNGALFLAEAITSVLTQTRPIDEILVIDDGSTDDSPAIAASFSRVRVIQKEHSGIAPTQNRGLAESTGDWISFLDQDDRWQPGKTEAQVEFLRSRPELAGVFGRARRFRMTRPEAGSAYEIALDVVPGLAKGAGLFHRRTFDQVGDFSTDQTHDFIDWYARALNAGLTFAVQEDVVLERRLHFSNYGVTQRSDQRQRYLMALKRKLDQQRSANSAPPSAST